jgi:hypothetical protein
MADASPAYRHRRPQDSQYYQCVEDHLEEFERVYDERFTVKYGFLRAYVKRVIYRYLDCGILHNGFARVRCKDCGHEYLLAFSCKRRHFCPSCHQKRVIQFGEWLCEEVLKAVPHRHFTFSLPKILRRYFLYDRRLLSDLSRSVWACLEEFFRNAVPGKGVDPGAVIAVQTFGHFLNFNPHCHVLCADGVFYGNGWFKVAPAFDTDPLEKLFQHKVLKMLLRKGKITQEVVKLILSWRHTGFNVHCGPRIQPRDEVAMENLARYVIRASISQERMTYIPGESKVLYRSKDGKKENVFDALEWLAAMCSHVPNKGEQMVRYYGYYSNVSRGKRKQANQDERIPCMLESEGSSKEYRKNWARLIQKIYEVDPLTCPKCSGNMKVISVIEDQEVIKKILKHLGLWEVHPPEERRVKPRPPPTDTLHRHERIDYSTSQLPHSDKWLYVDPEYPERFPS